MNENIFGIDVSNNDGSIDFSKVASDGVIFVIAKATDGTTIQDAYFNEFYQGCKNNGLKIGAYHFLEDTSEPETQAQNFWKIVKDHNLDLKLFLDVEKEFSEVADYTVRFLKEFKSLTSKEIGIYTYTSFLNEYLISIADEIKDYSLWEANYGVRAWNLSSNFFTKRVGHQYSETGTVSGVNTKCDLNVFTEDILVDSVSVPAGTWKIDNVGWWFEYADQSNGKYPVSQWAKLPKSNIDSTLAWFYFDDKGYMVTNWIYWNGNYYYLGQTNDGALKTEWFYDKTYGKWFYADSNGVMQKGWLKDDSTGKWYYLQKSKDEIHVEGEMRTGWIKVGDKDYCLYSDGSMIHDTIDYGYSFDSNGVATKLS